MKESFADKLFSVLAAARMQNGGKLPEDKWKAEVDAFADRERPVVKRPARPKPLTRPDLGDAEWITFLKNDPDFQGIDVEAQFAKMRYWCRCNDNKPTRLRFLKWLGSCDKVITTDGRSDKKPDVYTEPDPKLWRPAARLEFPGTLVHEAKWFDLATDFRARIIRRMGA